MNAICSTHHYRASAGTCERCNKPICDECLQHSVDIHGKKSCPACAKAYYDEKLPEWQADRPREFVYLGIITALMIAGWIIMGTGGGFGWSMACSTAAALVALFGSGVLGFLLSALGPMGPLISLAIILFFSFYLSGIIAPLSIIWLGISSILTHQGLKEGNERIGTLELRLAEAAEENRQKKIAAQQEAEANKRAQQIAAQERQAARLREEQERIKAEMERLRSIPATRDATPALYTLILEDIGPYRQDVIEELNKLGARRFDELESGMELVKNITSEESEGIREKLEAVGARVRNIKNTK